MEMAKMFMLISSGFPVTFSISITVGFILALELSFVQFFYLVSSLFVYNSFDFDTFSFSCQSVASKNVYTDGD